jgi:hypothetical protein
VGAFAIVVSRVGEEHLFEVSAADDRHPVETLARTVRTNRWAYAFAFGARIGVRMTLIPSPQKTSSKGAPGSRLVDSRRRPTQLEKRPS